ncbi:MAG: hypothetical protein ABR599_06880 [Gemmatimonadota bacterium]
MVFLPFAAIPIGDCFRLGGASLSDHVLRKLDSLRAEYVDGSSTVPVPEGTLVRPLSAQRLARPG